MGALLWDRKFFHATALLVGTMVGVGVFGIPFAFAKAGFWVGVCWLGVLAVVTLLYNLAFAELTLRTQGVHQISGYAGIWLGPWARRLTLLALVVSGYGALLAYMIVAGQFLHTVLSQFIAVDPDLYSIIFALGWSVFIIARLRTVAAIDLTVAALLTLTTVIVAIFGLRHINPANFAGAMPDYWFLPYGIIMFALSGANAIPIQRQLLAGREKLLKPAIITAVALVTAMYLVFAFVVVGVSGDTTTPEALSGLYDILGNGVIILGSLFGIMTISTSFLMMGTALYETFHIDYRLRRLGAWFLVALPPVLFFRSGLRNFIDVIGLIGSVSVGLLAIIVLAAYLKAKKISLRTPEWTIPMPGSVAWALMALFAAGIIYALVVR
jgi:amino acid permease